MIYKKEYKIEGKIISKDDIVNMINTTLKKMSKYKDVELKIIASFDSGISIEDKNLLIFDNIYFEKKLLQKMYIQIRSDSFNNSVEIWIGGNSSSYNSIEISTNDNYLYDSLCHSFEDSLNLMTNQRKIYLLSNEAWGYLLIYILMLLLEFLLVWSFESILNISIPSFILYFMVLLLPSIMVIYIIKYIQKYYPIIQFNFGETSINKPKKYNGFMIKFIYFVITNIALPIIISLVME